jgi:hypothetical protein
MKKFVQQARAFGETVADVVRRAVDPPLTADARPIDVKRAIVEAVERQLEPAGGGRRVLPGEALHVTVLAEDAERRKALEPVLTDLEAAIASRLLELRCVVPRRFAVEVSYVRRAPESWQPDQRLAVSAKGRDARPAQGSHRGGRLQADLPPQSHGGVRLQTDRRQGGVRLQADRTADMPPALNIDVVRGQAVKRHFTFAETAIRIGRSADPTDERGRPRLNDVAFLENDNAENQTVTRGHAMIRFDTQAGEYRLFDEGSANGTRILRSGELIEVPRRDPVGVSLRSGDEVQFGKAAIRIRLGEDA